MIRRKYMFLQTVSLPKITNEEKDETVSKTIDIKFLKDRFNSNIIRFVYLPKVNKYSVFLHLNKNKV